MSDRFQYFIYGSYPIPERWRVNIFFVMLAIGIVWLLWLEAPRRDLGAVYFFVIVPVNTLVARANRGAAPPDPAIKQCPECLSDVPIAAKRCRFCTSPLS